jgi:hypothetical protein
LHVIAKHMHAAVPDTVQRRWLHGWHTCEPVPPWLHRLCEMNSTWPTAYWMTQKNLFQVVVSCLPGTCLLLRLMLPCVVSVGFVSKGQELGDR